MNLATIPNKRFPIKTLAPLVRRANRSRSETETALRDMAFVLKMTERVKDSILRKRAVAGAIMA